METVAVFPPVEQEITEAVVEQVAEWGIELPECVVGEIFTGEAVPTDVEVGPDGHYYVTTLPGAPEAPGSGAVWRIDRRSGALTMLADGFSGAVDLAVAADGTIYATIGALPGPSGPQGSVVIVRPSPPAGERCSVTVALAGARHRPDTRRRRESGVDSLVGSPGVAPRVGCPGRDPREARGHRCAALVTGAQAW